MAGEKLTQTQHDNLMEWLYRMFDEEAVQMADAIRIFNASSAAFQQGVIRRRWYRKGTSVPVNRALLPDA
tara:strand:+ start:854 stop:1063 length:210 start_codon:yes stop_codon:yes gene_type:complete